MEGYLQMDVPDIKFIHWNLEACIPVAEGIRYVNGIPVDEGIVYVSMYINVCMCAYMQYIIYYIDINLAEKIMK